MIKIGNKEYNLYLINVRGNRGKAKRAADILRYDEIHIEGNLGIEYAIFRAEGPYHNGTKHDNWGCLYYFLLESRPKFAICLSYFQRPEKIKFDNLISQSWNEQLFSGRVGLDRLLLCRITKDLKKEYLLVKDEVKEKIKELVRWKK